MDTPIVDKVIEQLKALPQELQWRVLEFTRAWLSQRHAGSPAGSYCTLRARYRRKTQN